MEFLDRMAPVSIEAHGAEFVVTLQADRASTAAPAVLRVGRIFMAPGPPAGMPTQTSGGGRKKAKVGRTADLAAALGGRKKGAAGQDYAAGQWMLPPDGDEEVMRLNYSVLALTQTGASGAHGRRSRFPGPVAYLGDLACAPGSVAHAVASGKEAAMAIDLLLREGPGAVRPGLKRCAVGPGRSLSFEAYMNGPRSRRSSKVVRYGEINTDYFQFSPRLTQPRLLKAERVRSFAEIDLKISARHRNARSGAML